MRGSIVARCASGRAIRRFRGDARGIAATEFALILPVLVLVVILMVDFGLAFNARLRLSNAVTAASSFAFMNGSAVTAASQPRFAAQIKQIVIQNGPSVPPDVTVLFNDAADTSRTAQFFCLDGQPPRWRATGTAPADCGDGVQSARYVTIGAVGRFGSLFFSNPVFGPGLTMTGDVTVRLP